MPDRSALRREVIWYVAITFVFTYGFGAVRLKGGGLGGFVGSLAMFVPMLTAFAVQKTIVKDRIWGKGRLGFIVGKGRYLALAPLTVFALFLLIYGVTFLAKPALVPSRDELIARLAKASIVGNHGPVINAIIICSLNLFVAPLINLPLFLGEEVGWRSFLYPRLLSLFGKSGLLLGGLIWGLWHVPMILMGLNYPSHPISGVFLMCLFCTLWGILLQYFYSRSGSIFAVALAHGVMNWTATTVMDFFVVDKEFSLLVHGPTGLIGLAVIGPVAAWIYTQSNFGNPTLTAE
jgi:CAAX protease family protein